jgi:outer membrane protein assembly factor BamB
MRDLKRRIFRFKFILSLPLLILLIAIIAGCQQRKKSSLVWKNDLAGTGSQSSPRAADLNLDGTLDIVMGAGKNESQESDQGIIALNGLTGELLWQQPSTDQVYGSATFHDINDDGIVDVFIGGRSPVFKALNGKTGEVLWKFEFDHKNDSILKHARFNFNNSTLVPDQNKDGHPDLLNVNGGNSLAVPGTQKDRYPGVLILFDIKTGNILKADTMPDGKESYMSPLSFIDPENKECSIIFGTGGETISGNLYIAKLSDFMLGRLSKAKVIATEQNHGFIAPPVLADITNDGYPDIVAISHASTVFAIDGKTHQLLWKRAIANTECSNSFAVGQFTDDDVPDFFTFVSKGEWPNNTGSLQVMMDGVNGEIKYMDSIGCTGFSSPVVFDADHDGVDDAIISINEFDCSAGFTETAIKQIENKLLLINFKKGTKQIIDQSQSFKNIFSTPWIGDLDGNGYLDIVHCQYYSHGGLLTFLGTTIKRIETPIRVKGPVRWGAYMGSRGDGTY